MAQDRGRLGVQEYVNRQNNMALPKVDSNNENGAPKRMKSNPELESLKVPLNASKSNNKANAANGSAKMISEGRPHVSNATERRPQHVPADWETDASNADKSSTAGSIVPPQQFQQSELQHHHSQDYHHGFDPNDGNVGFESIQNFGHRSHYGFDMQTTDDRHRFSDLPHVQGDSYPDTTSGRPSEVDPQEEQPATRSYATKQQLPFPGLKTRGHSGARAGKLVIAQQIVPQPHLAAPVAVDGNANDPAGKGFTFGKPPHMAAVGKPNQKPATIPFSNPAPQAVPDKLHRQQAQPQTMQTQLINHRPPTRHAPQPGQVNPVVVHQNTVLRPFPEHEGYSSPRPIHQSDAPHGDPVQGREAPLHQFHGLAYGQQSDGALRHEDHAPTSDGARDHHMQDDHLRSEQPASEEDALDYDSKTIIVMGYDQLRSVPTDNDPKASAFDNIDVQQAGSLPEKLRIVQTLDRQAQSEFFRSLDLCNWEDAGDILVQRFGELVAKFKDGRREKRKAAQTFEDEIEQRHVAVSKKSDITKKAMQDMKKSGGQVLSSTPKKRKAAGPAPKKDTTKK